ncbi:MAG: thiamine biosynthesis lipoprotein [Candidatus Paceibacteria bacterium]|jgi:thiamine biosynthesis lipoprotein
MLLVMMLRRTLLLTLAVTICVGNMHAQVSAHPVLRKRTARVMGTSLELEAIGSDPDLLDKALDAALKEIIRVEDLMTDWRPSPLEDLNNAAGKGPQVVNPELYALIARGVKLGELSAGAFDITYAGAGKLWDFKQQPPLVPTTEQLGAALANVGYARLKLDPELFTIDLPAGMSVGLGGIAKGYGVDRAMAVLMQHGIQHGIVNAGGDLKALGTKFGKPWEIAIRHPRQQERVLALLPVSNVCVVTSGDYERFFEVDGKRYHHILDPRTGSPSTGCMSATVTAPDAALADALATALCVLSPESGLELVASLRRVEALLVGMDGQVHVSDGLKGLSSKVAEPK